MDRSGVADLDGVVSREHDYKGPWAFQQKAFLHRVDVVVTCRLIHWHPKAITTDVVGNMVGAAAAPQPYSGSGRMLEERKEKMKAGGPISPGANPR